MNFKNYIVSVVVPQFGCALTRDFLSALAKTNEKPDPKNRAPNGKVTFIYKFDEPHKWAKEQFVSSLNKIFKSDYLTFEVTEEEMFRNDWEKYEYLLKNHDWTFEMSDDHRSWTAGYNSQQLINYIRQNLSKEDKCRAEELYKKYCKINFELDK